MTRRQGVIRLAFVTGHDDGSVRLWDLDTGSTVNLKEPEAGHSNTVGCCRCSLTPG